MKGLSIFLAILSISGCSDYQERDVERIQLDEHSYIVVSMTEGGGALGDVIYRIYYIERGTRVLFFEGTNPRRFALSSVDGGVFVEFCYGNIRKAQPILSRTPTSRLIPVDVDLRCDQG